MIYVLFYVTSNGRASNLLHGCRANFDEGQLFMRRVAELHVKWLDYVTK